MAHVFISYSRRDQAFVRDLNEALAAAGRETWVDWEGIPPSTKWMEEIKGAIDSASAFLFVISPDSIDSDVCRQEVEYALQERKRVIPIVAREASGIPPALAEINWIAFPSPDDAQAVATLSRTLDSDPAWVHGHTRLNVRAHEWDKGGRDRAFLLRGRDLFAAERWLADAANHAEPKPTELHTEYVLASRANETRSQRLRLWAAGVAVAMLTALAAWALVERGIAVEQRIEAERQATLARARELAVTAAAQLEVDPETSLHIALASMEATGTPQGEDVLVRALLASRATAIVQPECRVSRLSFGPAGRHIVAFCEDSTLLVLDAATGREAHRTRGVRSARLDAVEKRLFAALEDGAVRVVDLTRGERVGLLQADDARFSDVTIDAAKGRIYAYGASGGVHFWDAATLRHEGRIAPDVGDVHSLHLSPDGGRLGVWADETRQDFYPLRRYMLRYWDAASGEAIEGVGGRELSPGWARVNTRGTIAVLRPGDGFSHAEPLEVWQLEKPAKLAELPVVPEHVFRTIRFDADDNIYALDGERVAVWSPQGEKRPGTPERGAHAGSVTDLAVSPVAHRRFLLTASEDGTAKIWTPGQPVSQAVLRGHRGPVHLVALSPDGWRAVTAGIDGTLRLWELGSRAIDERFRTAWGGHAFLDQSADGRIALLKGRDGSIHAVELRTGKELRAFAAVGLGKDTRPESSAWGRIAPRGDRVILVNLDTGEAMVQDLVDGRRISSVRVDARGGLDGRFDPRSARVLLQGRGVGVAVYDAGNGTLVRRITKDADDYERFVFHPDGRRLIALHADDRSIHVWDLGHEAAGPEIVKADATDFALSPDGRMLAVAEGQASVRVFRLGSPDAVATLLAPAVVLAFSPHGGQLAAQDEDGTLRVWDAGDWTLRMEFRPEGAARKGGALRYSADGRLLITNQGLHLASTGTRVDDQPDSVFADGVVSNDGTRILHPGSSLYTDTRLSWPLVACGTCAPNDGLIDLARARLARKELSRPEREHFLHIGTAAASAPGRKK